MKRKVFKNSRETSLALILYSVEFQMLKKVPLFFWQKYFSKSFVLLSLTSLGPNTTWTTTGWGVRNGKKVWPKKLADILWKNVSFV